MKKLSIPDLKSDIFNKIDEYLLKKKFKKSNIIRKSNLKDLIFNIISILSKNPLTDYSEIIKKLEITLEELKELNLIIQDIDYFQQLIINNGVGTKYWKNMIIPLINSKSITNFLNKEYSYPFKVGIYPGISCMYECSFCGRNYDARYKRDSLDKGIELYKALIDEAPRDDKNRFYISGGLEPFTNPKLNQIISHLKNNNFNSSMYTNGYMLTSKYLNKLEKL